MIRRIALENHCSFLGSNELNLTASSKTPTDDSFVTSVKGDQISTLAGIFGPNASGKTNLLKSLVFLGYFLRHSYHDEHADEAIPIDPYAHNNKLPSRFTLEFEGLGEVYLYELEIQKGAVKFEQLSKLNSSSNKYRYLLKRNYLKKKLTITSAKNFTNTSTLTKLLNDRPNTSLLAAGLVTGRREFKDIDKSLGEITTNVTRRGKKTLKLHEEVINRWKHLEENPHLKSLVETHLKRADLGISKFVTREMINNHVEVKKVLVPFIEHQGHDSRFTIPLYEESSGTQQLFALLCNFLSTVTNGGTIVIDEMESDLHPHLIPMLLDFFIDKEINPKRAQLIFTCHHIETLNHLSKEQITFVEKDKNNVSHSFRLSDVKGVRREENYFANYNAGRYQAVPELQTY